MKAPRISGPQRVGHLRLSVHGWKVRVVDVDRQQFEAILRRNVEEAVIIGVRVHMRIEFANLREVRGRI